MYEKIILLPGIILSIIYLYFTINKYVNYLEKKYKYTKKEMNIDYSQKKIIVITITFAIAYIVTIIYELMNVFVFSTVIYIFILILISTFFITKAGYSSYVKDGLEKGKIKKDFLNEDKDGRGYKEFKEYLVIKNIEIAINIFLILLLLIYIIKYSGNIHRIFQMLIIRK